MKKLALQLDSRKLLGFRLVAGRHAMGAKSGGKVIQKIGAKTGGKVGVK